MSPPGSPRRRERRRSWAIDLLSGLMLLALLLAGLSRNVSAISPGQGADGLHHHAEAPSSSLLELLEYHSLPVTFTYGGLTWRATSAVRLPADTPLRAMPRIVEGYDVYRVEKRRADPVRVLYVPTGQRSRVAPLYVRYEPEDPRAQAERASPARAAASNTS